MPDETQLLYLEPDDEITTVVRRLREADAPRVILVASGRTKATTSAVALRLLAQVAQEEGREVVLVADPAARALAADAGIPAFGSVAEASVEGATPTPAPPPASAPIHVVRGEPETLTVDEPPAPVPAAAPPAPVRGMEETQAVPIPPRPSARRRAAPGRSDRRPRAAASSRVRAIALVGILAMLAGMGAAIATVLPAASITIRPQSVAVGPLTYSVVPEVHPSDAEPLEATMDGEATGHRTKLTAATGIVTFINYSDENVFVPAGTVVSAGREILFQTTAGIDVPDSSIIFGAGVADAPVAAVEKGSSGNVDSDAIDRVEDRNIDRALRGGGNERRVRNQNPITGGEEVEQLVVRQRDVEAVADAIRADLNSQLEELLADKSDRIYPTGDAPRADIPVPDDLVGHVSDEPFTFELTGTLVDERPYALLTDVEDAAREQFLADPAAQPEGAELDQDSITIEIGEATLEDEVMSVEVTVAAAAAPEVNEELLRSQLAGKTATEAQAALAHIGPATVDLWPTWVDRVPRLNWRISIEIDAGPAPAS